MRTACLALGVCLLTALCSAEEVDVRAHGAKGDGSASDTTSIQAAIDACAAAGGGTVYFPPGTYVSGSLHLRSHVTLHLKNGATLLGSRKKSEYDPYETLGFENDSDVETTFFHLALIWGEDVESIAIEGQGTIDSNFTQRGGPKAIALKRCRHVQIKDVTIQNVPNYAISMLGTDYVNIDGVTILRGLADGIDPDACRNVRIANCHIESVDDAIVPKASFSLGERRSTENITVTNCYLATECNGFKLGTESGGDFKRIAATNCIVAALPGHRPPRGGICIESVDGSNIDGVVVDNFTMIGVRMPVFIRLGNRGRDLPAPVPGSLRNVNISNVTATAASMACALAGIPGHPLEEVALSNIRIDFAGGAPYCEEQSMEELEANYPDPEMFPCQPCYALYVRHATGLTLSNLSFSYAPAFWRVATAEHRKVQWHDTGAAPDPSTPGGQGPALVLDDTRRVRLSGLGAQPGPDAAVMRLWNANDVLVSGCIALENTTTFAEIHGEASGNILFTNNLLTRATTTIARSKEVPESALVTKEN